MPGCPASTSFILAKKRGWPGRQAMTLLSRQRPLQQAPDIVVGEIDGAVHAGVISGEPGRARTIPHDAARPCSVRPPPRAAPASRPPAAPRVRCPAGGTPCRSTPPHRPRRAIPWSSPARPCNTAAAASASRDSARNTSRHITLPEPSQIALTGDFPVVPRQNALLHIAVAAEALHRLVEKSRRALAHPVFDRRASAAA